MMPEDSPPDDIDADIDSLLAEWALEKREREARQAEALRARLEHRRERLLSRQWKPTCCQCRTCLRAIILMRPDLACRQSEQWWL
jgi:hypothetical protein